MALLFGVAIALSAALLFWVELMVAKMVLPKFGGGPAVWNTCMLFFQASLLLGYTYAHLLPARLGVRRQIVVHGVVILLPLLVLPTVMPEGWEPQPGLHPVAALLAYLMLFAGLPFFVVSTTTPLLQKWFAGTTHAGARDPYFLYAASNVGSFAGLIGYPLLIEPTVGLRVQGWMWAAGYGVLLVLLAGCAACAWRGRPAASAEPAAATPAATPPTAGLRAYWCVLAFVPSSLMLGVTTYFTTEIAPVPLIWVVPLAVYLLTFIIAFGKLPAGLLRAATFVLPVVVLGVAWVMTDRSIENVKLFGAMKRLVPLHLATLFVAGLVMHGQLARTRPDVRYLTEYFLWIALGGVCGGLFNGLIAPLLFSTTVEYPLTLVLAALLAPPWWELRNGLGARRVEVFLAVPAALVAGAIFAVNAGKPPLPGQRVLHRERNFFGVISVTTNADRGFNRFFHGNTEHGAQNVGDAKLHNLPLLYFYHNGPVGQTFFAFRGPRAKKHVGIIGLGAGTLAAYGEKGQEITIFEIDPAVERAARKYFSYLEDSPAECRTVIGDGRLTLAREPDGHFGILVLDAFSSDSIPVHLVTEEAVRLYVQKLAPDGIIVMHISNNYVDLESSIAAVARACKLQGLVQLDTHVTPQEARLGKRDSHWVVLARERDHFGPLNEDGRWKPLRGRKRVSSWTDDYSNLFQVLNWN